MDRIKPLRIIENRAAPNCRRVRIFLAEKGIEIPYDQIDIMAGDHFKTEYREKVGTYRVPVLELSDGSFLTESIAICRFFEMENPEIPLFGRTQLEVSLVEMWQRRMEFELLWPIAFVLRHGNPKMTVLEDQCEAWSVANRPRVLVGLETLNKQLTHNQFIVGPNFSVADITAIVAVNFLRTIRVEIPEHLEFLLNWKSTVSQRSSIGA